MKNNITLEKRLMRSISKGINEGFRSWKEDNTPKFDTKLFTENAKDLLTELLSLKKDADVYAFYTVGPNGTDNWLALCRCDANTEVEDKDIEEAAQAFIEDTLDKANKKYEDEFAANMQKGYVQFATTPNSALFNFVNNNIDPSNPKVLKNCEFINVSTGKVGSDAVYLLKISFNDIIENIEKIMQWFY